LRDQSSDGDQPGTDRREQHDPIDAARARGVDHDFGLGGAGADVKEEHTVDSAQGCENAVSVIKVPDDRVDTLWKKDRASGVTNKGTNLATFFL
jgi:hypothetical protein